MSKGRLARLHFFISLSSSRVSTSRPETPGTPVHRGMHAPYSRSFSVSLLIPLSPSRRRTSKSAPARRTSLLTFALHPGLYSAFPPACRSPPSLTPSLPSLSFSSFFTERSMGRGPIRTHVARGKNRSDANTGARHRRRDAPLFLLSPTLPR